MSGRSSKYDGYTQDMSADTAVRHEETDRLKTNCFKEIEENNGLRKGPSDESRIDQVSRRCLELRKDDGKLHDYFQQKLDVTFNTSKYDGYTCYMSADTAGRREELHQRIETSLTEIEENSELLRGLKRLIDEDRIDQVLSRFVERWMDNDKHDYLQQELNVTFNMRDENVRRKELCDVLFYYLLRDEEPVDEIKILIRMIDSGYPFANGWYDISTMRLGLSRIIFRQFYKRLGNEPQHLEYLLYKQPQLLFNYYSPYLIGRLNEHLPHDKLHQILLNTRDENGQTFTFNTNRLRELVLLSDSRFEDAYRNKFDDLCELLSVRNESGKTALHVSSNIAYDVLLERITLNNQDKVNELLSIRDNNNKTVYDTANDRCKKQLTWLKHQYEHNNYPLYDSHRVLILYNTNDRPGAEEEAESIKQAFESVTNSYSIKLEKMGTKREVLQLIAQQAQQANWNPSVLIVCSMSHGNIGTIDDSEGNSITLTSIEGAMCSDRLKERPKILITQSCQTRAGGRRRTHEEATCSNTDRPPFNAFVTNIPYEPVADHFLSVQSCVSGQESTRNVFIPYLAEQIKHSSKTDCFVDLVPNASYKMVMEGDEQIPIVKSTLRGKVCLKDQYTRDKS